MNISTIIVQKELMGESNVSISGVLYLKSRSIIVVLNVFKILEYLRAST